MKKTVSLLKKYFHILPSQLDLHTGPTAPTLYQQDWNKQENFFGGSGREIVQIIYYPTFLIFTTHHA